MTLKELSAQYEASAKPIRERLRELRVQLAGTKDPEKIWHLKRRIAELTPMLTQVNALAELTAKYYERGYWRNGEYSSNSLRESKSRAVQEVDEDHPDRPYGVPAGYSNLLPDAGNATVRVRPTKRRKQIHCESHPSRSDTEDSSLLAVLMNADPDMIASLFYEKEESQ